MVNRYALFGSPVLHSKSPRMFKSYFETESLLSNNYVTVIADNPPDVIKLARRLKLNGFNVTSPFKNDIFQVCDFKSEIASLLSAVNFVKIDSNGNFHADNTDYLGLMNIAKKLGDKLLKKNALVLGCGGSGRAAALAFKNAGYETTVSNRNESKGLAFSEQFGLNFLSLENSLKNLNSFDLIISTVPHIISSPFADMFTGIFIDAIYSDRLTPGKALCTYLPGEEWLIAQANYNARLWGYTPLEPIFRHAAYFTPPIRKNIVLSGFTGAGKTSVGKALAGNLGYDFIDTDEMIERETGMSIQSIFGKRGEQSFRQLESEILYKIAFSEKSVISLGGGTLDNPLNYLALKNLGLIIWLDFEKENLFSRTDISSKPVLADKSPEQIDNLIKKRDDTYFLTADAVILNEEFNKTVNLLYEEISKAFGN